MNAKRRVAVSDYFREQASWRWLSAEQNPADHRQPRSAQALEDLARHLDGLSPKDPRVVYLARHLPGPGGGLGGMSSNHALSQWGLRRRVKHEWEHDQFLARLCALCARDAYEYVCELAKDFAHKSPRKIAARFALTEEDARAALANEHRPSSHFRNTYGMTVAAKPPARPTRVPSPPTPAAAVIEQVAQIAPQDADIAPASERAPVLGGLGRPDNEDAEELRDPTAQDGEAQITVVQVDRAPSVETSTPSA
jgi:hypothetical protein